MCPVLALGQTFEKIKDKTEPKVESVDPPEADLLTRIMCTQLGRVVSIPCTHLWFAIREDMHSLRRELSNFELKDGNETSVREFNLLTMERVKGSNSDIGATSSHCIPVIAVSQNPYRRKITAEL